MKTFVYPVYTKLLSSFVLAVTLSISLSSPLVKCQEKNSSSYSMMAELPISEPTRSHFSHEQPWVSLGASLARPRDKIKDQGAQYTYDSYAQGQLHLPVFWHLDFNGRYFYQFFSSKEKSPLKFADDSNRTQRGNLSLGYAILGLRPGWRMTPQIGAFYSTLPFHLEGGQNKLLVPQLSANWSYNQSSQGLFNLNIKYVHLDKGSRTSEGNRHLKTPYGYGVEVGQIIPLNYGLGFFYSITAEQLFLNDDQDHFHKTLYLITSAGLAY